MPRRTFKKFRKYRKRFTRRTRRVPRKNTNQRIHFFKRTMKLTFAIDDAAFQPLELAEAGSYNNYNLAQLPDYAEFQDLYDSFKICGIKAKFIFDRTNAPVANVTQMMPNLITVKDYNDNSAPADEDEMLQYKTFKVKRIDRPIIRYFKPQTDYTTGMHGNKWIDTSGANPSSPYHGLKAAVLSPLAGAGETPQGKLNVYLTYYLAMKTPK